MGDDSRRIVVLRRDGEEERERAELAAALRSEPRRIPSRHFYDARGSRLFEEITRLPEYYLTRAERALLASVAAEIAETTRAEAVFELGSGSASKTRLLLDALGRAGTLEAYVPLDASESALRASLGELARDYPTLELSGFVGDFTGELPDLPRRRRRLVLFLGSTIGNFRPPEAVAFLGRIAASLGPDDHFLLGADLVKDVARLEAAYNDAAGVTAEFNRNILRVVNRRFGADFDPAAFAHRAFFEGENRWIEMRLAAETDHGVRVAALGLALPLRAGEEILTEISAKYDRPAIEALFAAAGLRLERWYTDAEPLFALALGKRDDSRPAEGRK